MDSQRDHQYSFLITALWKANEQHLFFKVDQRFSKFAFQ